MVHNHINEKLVSVLYKAGSRFAPSQRETASLCSDVSWWLGASLESALQYYAIEQIPVEVSIPLSLYSSVWYIMLYLKQETGDNAFHDFFSHEPLGGCSCKYICISINFDDPFTIVT